LEKHILSLPAQQIRAAVPADCPAIFGLIKELAEYEKLSSAVTGTVAMLQESLFGAQPVAQCVVIEDADKNIFGMALYFFTFSTFLTKRGMYLEDLYVQPDKRGGGHGRALLLHLAAKAKALDCGRFEWRVLDWNTPAIDFYKSLGATIMPEWHLVRLDELGIAALAKN
jgi:GNAT superfamily N-acetyltransferase